MTTVKVKAKKTDVSDLTQKLMKGLDLSYSKLLMGRCRSNGTFCFCDEQGRIFTVSAKEVKAMMNGK